MLPEDGIRLIWLGVLVLAVGVLGIGTILALLSAWRNQGRREKLLQQGRELRAGQPHNRRHRAAEAATVDVWAESGRRHRDGNADAAEAGENDGDNADDDRPQR